MLLTGYFPILRVAACVSMRRWYGQPRRDEQKCSDTFEDELASLRFCQTATRSGRRRKLAWVTVVGV